ncbi:L-histidine N(alpha)-methyltransferase [Immundisolibacter cernigliae]|uniref:Dimethylhistidine N-methyltransferase n=1 Tax=Immundisolibacter cernigliae TaxID=1810504 RepID=A0A1B1YW51_9GAMM|nr:L-histidine N(alpha)-methyltransferase [Immundisolibacter cernigliae]ANX05011.1 dimethylhistidine N-methyltransferase [Immundisolibacter cernigliae]
MNTLAKLRLHDLAPEQEDFRTAVLEGLTKPHKSLPCKFFYDAVGSALFDRICELPEYYPTRTEIDILTEAAPQIADLAGRGGVLVEYGSGSSMKTRLLLDALAPDVYMPIDISRQHMLGACHTLAQDYPALHLMAVCADYTRPFTLPRVARGGQRRLAFFPGSSIGNFAPLEALRFLKNVAHQLTAGDGLLIGVDLKKDPAILNAAYNDSAGVTAAFNLNLLARCNRELGTNFDLSAFAHRAFYNAAAGRIEMHLDSLRAQTVRLAGQAFEFTAGESIHTENSYKYRPDEFRHLATQAGFEPRQTWADTGELFGVLYLRRR